jgi:hypothetical protein
MRSSTVPLACDTTSVGVLTAFVVNATSCAKLSALVAADAELGPVALDFESIDIDVRLIEHPVGGASESV